MQLSPVKEVRTSSSQTIADVSCAYLKAEQYGKKKILRRGWDPERGGIRYLYTWDSEEGNFRGRGRCDGWMKGDV